MSDVQERGFGRGWHQGAFVAILIAIFFMAVAISQVVPTRWLAGRLARVWLAGQEFHLELADTPNLQQQGLSGRPSIPNNGGMLFLFDPPRNVVFWMKDMRFPIDIIWVHNQRIVGYVSAAAPPDDGKPEELAERFPSPQPVDSVLELQAGRAKELGVEIGQAVQIQLPYNIGL